MKDDAKIPRKNARGRASSLNVQLEIYGNMIQNCAVAIFAIDTGHRVIHWNRACEGLTGIMASEVLGTGGHWKAFYEHERPCLSDLIVDGDLNNLGELYGDHGPSVLISQGLHAEGWYPDVGGKRRYLIFDASPIYHHDGKLLGAVETLQDITARKLMEEEKLRLNDELIKAMNQIKTLSGLIPICAACKKIRDDKGYWNQIESYLEEHSEVEFSHGLCPECFRIYFPEAAKAREE